MQMANNIKLIKARVLTLAFMMSTSLKVEPLIVSTDAEDV